MFVLGTGRNIEHKHIAPYKVTICRFEVQINANTCTADFFTYAKEVFLPFVHSGVGSTAFKLNCDVLTAKGDLVAVLHTSKCHACQAPLVLFDVTLAVQYALQLRKFLVVKTQNKEFQRQRWA